MDTPDAATEFDVTENVDDGRFVDVNEGFENNSGYRRDVLV